MDLETLMNDMSTSLESLYPACNMQSDTVPLCQNGQHSRNQPPPSGARSQPPQASPWQKVQRSQPMHILAVRWDQGPRRAVVHSCCCSLLGRWWWGEGVGLVRAMGGRVPLLCLA